MENGKIDFEKVLSEAEIDEIIQRHLNPWLKDVKKIKQYNGAKNFRKQHSNLFRKIIDNYIRRYPNLKRINETIDAQLLNDNGQEREILKNLKEFLEYLTKQSEHPSTASSTPEESTQIDLEKKARDRKVIGKVTISQTMPSTPTSFVFWVKDDDEIHVEIGDVVTARKDDLRITGIVSDLSAFSDIHDTLESFYAHNFGEPEWEPLTRLPVVLTARTEVIRRSDNRLEPIRGSWPVSFATANEIRKAYGSDIPQRYQMLAGFTYDAEEKEPVSITLDARYVLGYEAAHVNISGASGVATKTSYALFLLFSILAYGRRNQNDDSVGVIVFNVKEADLMFIDQLPEWENLERANHKQHLEFVKLWKKAREDFKIDPIDWWKKGDIEFFAPRHYSEPEKVLSQRQQNVRRFCYELQTIIDSGVGSLYTLFDPEDLDEKAVSLIASMAEVAKSKELSFKSLIEEIQTNLKAHGRKDWILLNGVSHHVATTNKILNRLNHALDNQLKGVVVKDSNEDNPIPIDDLRPGKMWVIDITQLSDKGQRLVFHTIIRTVFRKLEERKALELTGQLDHSPLKNFPRHVVLFVDELNKFVPSGREFSVLKSEIVEIAARGRSVGLCLCGAQQLASKIDEEVLANTSTFIVGRSHPVEIHKTPYGWLPEGFKRKVTFLDKGWLFLWHTVHKQPVLIHFPLPLHRLKEELEKTQ
ncbi:MAG: ATP-binding protein [Pseudothermotoga sp.]